MSAEQDLNSSKGLTGYVEQLYLASVEEKDAAAVLSV
jgi:hypothetical protein